MNNLKSLHTFALDAKCAALTQFSSPDQLVDLARRQSGNMLVLGGGSNTLFLEDYAGTVALNKISGIRHREDRDYHYLTVGAGENWHNLVQRCMQAGWFGLENLALIPGSVGAAPIQNIGAYGVEAGQLISKVNGILLGNGAAFELSADECQFGYRDSIFKQELAGRAIISSVEFTLPKHYELDCNYGELAKLSSPTAMDVFTSVIKIRQSKLPDPAHMGNAGSFFKNPTISRTQYAALAERFPALPGFAMGEEAMKVPAAWFIDQLGFKGHRVGDACCHIKQPLVLANLGSATGLDVLTLAREIQTAVREAYDIHLEPEVRLMGRNGIITL